MDINQKPYINLLDECFPGIKNNIVRWEALGYSWESSKIFIKEENGEVVSHAALMECPVIVEGQWQNIGALHCICTQEDLRGRGLASELIREAVEWTKGRCDAVILFTEIPEFYERLAFRQIQEYRFHLPKIYSKGSKALRSINATQDHELFMRCFRERGPVSKRVWIKENGTVASFNSIFTTYPVYGTFYYCPAIDGLISYVLKDGALHLYDVVAGKMPALDLIVDHMPEPIKEIYFYFSPDQFTNDAIPEPYVYDNNHFMVHGSWPISKPCMIAPFSRA